MSTIVLSGAKGISHIDYSRRSKDDDYTIIIEAVGAGATEARISGAFPAPLSLIGAKV